MLTEELSHSSLAHFFENLYIVYSARPLNTGILLIIVLYFLWYMSAYLSKTKVIGTDGSYIKELAARLPSFQSGYRPTFWCFPSIPSTVILTLIQTRIVHNYDTELVHAPDGGQFQLFWLNRDHSKSKFVVIIIPGFAGNPYCNYSTHLAEEAKKLGCIVAIVNYRGICAELLTQRAYCGCQDDDLELVLTRIRSEYPDYSLFTVAISYGGMILGKYLSRNNENCCVSHAMFLACPYNPSDSYDELEKPQFSFINRLITNDTIRFIQKNKHLYENDSRFDLAKIAQCKSMRDIDAYYTCKLNGFDTRDELFNHARLDASLKHIKTQALFLNSSNDMFSPKRSIPIEAFKSNENIALILTKYGGHLGFVEGWMPTGCSYECRLFRDYLTRVISSTNTST